ncbi:GNAT family N-acetyltransferase [Photobacterium sp. TLY01]|uniref:GNAT family N-acetyltransferase n=1 Tax=Photobacterium sp. TLY01 TaxID=2907534 RepID=UPI001F4287A4|nr:GNAT family N-acetyltransferase [Photobacterium sp. TLY01]UIP29873.1 GNAT family N-acetyltransferase [Photobacterium sp. TLY01]
MEISLLADCPSEAPKIAKWYYDEWARMAPNVTEEMVLEKVIEKSVNRNQIPLSFVAHIDSELAGVLELKVRENKNYPEYENWVGGVYTNPKYRGKGIASKLLESAKEKAIDIGVKKLYLQCESFNVSLYLNHGFSVLHQAQHHDIETTIMVWEAAT